MSRKPVPLSKGESVVATALWRLGKSSLGDLHAEITKSDSMEYATVQSYIRRLEAKGYVKSKRVGRSKVYSPRIKPETVIGRTVEDLMKQFFGGETIPLVRHLINERGVSDDELAELKRIVEEADGRSGTKDD